MMIITAVFWLLVLVGIALVLAWVLRRWVPPSERESALDILKKRYARGEIGREEYERMKRELS